MTALFKTILTICFLFSIFGLAAQTVTASDFFTATNASANGTLSVGTNDLHWKVSDLSINGPYVPAVSCGYVYNGWHFSNIQNANWISFPNTCVNGDYAEHSCLNPTDQDRFYKNSFYIPGTSCESSNLAPGVFCLNLNLRADNCIYEVFVNGQSVFTTNIPNPYWHMGFSTAAAEVLTLCDNWKSGLNEIIVHVTSSAGAAPTWEGLLATATLTFNAVANQTSAPISMTATGSTYTCTNQNAGTASVSVITAGANISYTWLPMGGNAATASNLSAGIYTVIVSNGICTKTETALVQAINAPTVSVSGPSKSVCKGQTVILSASGTQFYSWQPGNVTTASISVLAGGATVYTVTGSNSNSNGCSSTKTISVISQACTDLERMLSEHKGVGVFPNPSPGLFNITNVANSTLEVFDEIGQKLLTIESEESTSIINLSAYANGLYYVYVRRHDQVNEVIKLMKE